MANDKDDGTDDRPGEDKQTASNKTAIKKKTIKNKTIKKSAAETTATDKIASKKTTEASPVVVPETEQKLLRKQKLKPSSQRHHRRQRKNPQNRLRRLQKNVHGQRMTSGLVMQAGGLTKTLCRVC